PISTNRAPPSSWLPTPNTTPATAIASSACWTAKPLRRIYWYKHLARPDCPSGRRPPVQRTAIRLNGPKGPKALLMLKNYLKIAFRNLAKYKFISFINLFGLCVGLACCLLIGTYILHETSYDKYNHNADRIWRVNRSFNNKDGIVSLRLG